MEKEEIYRTLVMQRLGGLSLKDDKSVEQIRNEIINSFGYFPAFFSPALDDPNLLNALWQETLEKYVRNKLPSFWKELLFAYLSKECGNSYCQIVHTCKLTEFDLTAQDVRDLFGGFEKLGVDRGLKDLLRLSLQFYMHSEDIGKLVQKLKKNLGSHYDDWVAFISFIASSHRWAEGHMEEISYKNDEYAKENLKAIVDEAGELEQILRL